ncbi:hypothetical protein DPMN_093465, partial [Dreissena polymorpha]
MTCIISILPSIHVSSFMKKYGELTKLLQDPEECDRLTDRHTNANHKSPPISLVGENNHTPYLNGEADNDNERGMVLGLGVGLGEIGVSLITP